VGAACVVGFWKIPSKNALALCNKKVLRFWSLTAIVVAGIIFN
jgi:hypothetical protein